MVMYWWETYGPFDPQEDGFPNAGQVVQHYRMLKGWKPADLGRALQKTARWVQAMEKDNTVPELLSRRRAIAAMLSIPPALLGLAAIDMNATAASVSSLVASGGKVDVAQVEQYHTLLRLYWDLDYASTAQESLDDVVRWIKHLRKLAPEAGVYQQEIIGLQCRYHQLACWIARDQRNYPVALSHANQAIKLAKSLSHPELLAASLFRRGRTKLEQGDLEGAVRDLDAAAPYAQKSRAQLRALVLLANGHARAYLASTPTEVAAAFALIDQAAKIVRRGGLEDDESFVKLSTGRYHLDRADALIVTGRPKAGREELDLATQGIGTEQTRRHAYANVLLAKSYSVSGDALMAASTAESALEVVREIGSVVNIARLAEVHQTLSESRHGNEPDVRRLGMLLVTRR